MTSDLGSLKLAGYFLIIMLCPLCTNGSTATSSWSRCQGQRSAVLVVSTSSDYQIPPLPFPSRAEPRADANDPYFYSPFHLVSRAAPRTLFVPRLLADPRASVIFVINGRRPFVKRWPGTGLCTYVVFYGRRAFSILDRRARVRF